VINFLPEFQIWHSRQVAGLEGLDLEATCHQQILQSARKMALDSIHQISDTEFFVTSESHLSHHYLINLNELTCDCVNFLRIRHCKHIAAINMHFPRLCPKVDSCSKIPECACVLDLPKPPPRLEEETAEILITDINMLCQQLNALSDHPTLDLKALKGVKYSLNTVISLANGSWALPEKDVFHPNSNNTWAEMAKCMGVGKAPKWKPGLMGGNMSMECIGPVKGKLAHKYTDPYAAGERLGKHAKPNAVSTAANECAHASVPAPLPLVHSPTCMSPSATVADSAAHPFTYAD